MSDDPAVREYCTANLVSWLRAKYKRHGELEDKYAADALESYALKLDGYQTTFNAVAERLGVAPDAEFVFEDVLVALDKKSSQLSAVSAILDEHRIASKPCALNPLEAESYFYRIRKAIK